MNRHARSPRVLPVAGRACIGRPPHGLDLPALRRDPLPATAGARLFHLSTWLLVSVGSALTVRAWRRGELAPPWRTHVGLLLAGWGAFNLVEGLVDHQPLGIHHVRDDLGGPLGWDLAFLALGAALLATGLAMARSGERMAGRQRLAAVRD